jgi:putative peptidoglycan lipid II flippase
MTEPGVTEPAPSATETSADPADPPGSGTVDTARSSVFVAAGILFSRLSGLLRSVALAATLGTTPAADAFRAALRIPQLLQNLLGEGALSAAFIPVYARELDAGRDRDAGRLAGAIAGLIAAVTAGLVLVGVLLARPLTTVLAPGFEGATEDLTVQLTRIMTAGLGFVVLAAWCLGVLNAHRRFFLSYAAPVLWNAAQVGFLLAAVALDEGDADIARWTAWGVFVGGILQFLVQLPAVVRVAPSIRLSLSTAVPGVRDVLRRFGPAVLGRGIVQIGAYLDLVLASLLVTGSVTSLDLAQILYLLPISLFAISIAAAELPELSRTVGDGELLDRVAVATRRVSFFMVGATVAFVVGGGAICGAVYQWGEFDSTDTLLVWMTLAAYSLSLVPSGAGRMLQNALFSRGDTAGPAWIAAGRVAVAAALGLVLMFQFERIALEPDEPVDDVVEVVGDSPFERVDDLPAPLEPLPDETRSSTDTAARAGVVGLALGSAVAAWVEYLLLRRRVHGAIGAPPRLAPVVRSLAVPAMAAAGAVVAVQLIADSAPLVVQAAAVGVVGGLVYLGVGLALRNEVATGLRDRIGRAGPGPQDAQ